MKEALAELARCRACGPKVQGSILGTSIIYFAWHKRKEKQATWPMTLKQMSEIIYKVMPSSAGWVINPKSIGHEFDTRCHGVPPNNTRDRLRFNDNVHAPERNTTQQAIQHQHHQTVKHHLVLDLCLG